MKSNKSHYKKEYYEYQAEGIGEEHILHNITRYRMEVKEEDIVLDFGCGTGFLLGQLSCKRRVGVELNLYAHKKARENGVEVYESIDALPEDLQFDIIISNHALVHCTRPLDELIRLEKRLKPEGKLLLAVPFEGLKRKFVEGDDVQHLYTFSPLNIGNLVSLAGFRVKSIKQNSFIIPKVLYPMLKDVNKSLSYIIYKMIGILFKNRLSEHYLIGTKRDKKTSCE